MIEWKFQLMREFGGNDCHPCYWGFIDDIPPKNKSRLGKILIGKTGEGGKEEWELLSFNNCVLTIELIEEILTFMKSLDH